MALFICSLIIEYFNKLEEQKIKSNNIYIYEESV